MFFQKYTGMLLSQTQLDLFSLLSQSCFLSFLPHQGPLRPLQEGEEP